MPHRNYRWFKNAVVNPAAADVNAKTVVPVKEIFPSLRETGTFSPSDVFQAVWDNFFAARENKQKRVLFVPDQAVVQAMKCK